MSQRTYELQLVYDWVGGDTQARSQITQAAGALEAARELLCAAIFADCEEGLLQRSIEIARPWAANSGAQQGADAIEICSVASGERTQRLACGASTWAWAEKEYGNAVHPFIGSPAPMHPEVAKGHDMKKVVADPGYVALTYPPELTPGRVCSATRNQDPEAWPVFGGEAFGDMAWVDVTNQRSRHLSMVALLELLENSAPMAAHYPQGLSRVAVNFGAGDGVCRVGHGVDPANCLMTAGYRGVLFEANRTLEPAIRETIGERNRQLQLRMEPALPRTVSRQLGEALAALPGPAVHKNDIDLIKVDVDGLDCDLMWALNNDSWLPKVWHVEVNPHFPPGIRVWPKDGASGKSGSRLASAFARRWGESSVGQAQELVGCSLQAVLDILEDTYVLLHLEFENAVLLRKDLAPATEPWRSSRSDFQKWLDGYFCHPLARLRLPHDRDEDSLFLHYDFRSWADPALSPVELEDQVARFLEIFVGSSDSLLRGSSKVLGFPHERWTMSSQNGAWVLEDPDCEAPWKGEVFQWELILGNAQRVLQSWAKGDGQIEVVLISFVEEIVRNLNIDRAWSLFKNIIHAECPLGGLTIAAALRWRCASDEWALTESAAPHTALLFSAMRRQLPLKGRGEPRGLPHTSGPGHAAPLGCIPLLERYIQSLLHHIDLAATLRSKWPVFEMLSALHMENKAWPRTYP